MVSVSFTPTEPDNFYAMRVWTEDVGGDGTKTTTTSAQEPTTSSTPNRSIPFVIVLAIAAAVFA